MSVIAFDRTGKPAPGTPMPTSEHPIRSFPWGDYRVVSVYSKPKLIELNDASAATVEIDTEPEQGSAGDDGQAAHDIYSNRGVAGSQAYARWKNKTDKAEPVVRTDSLVSRRLFETLPGSIVRAEGAQRPSAALLHGRVMLRHDESSRQKALGLFPLRQKVGVFIARRRIL